jgi:alpha-beta hydrolase superfamily lysophospholipase
MTADIKQLADLARDENPGLTAYHVRASMGSALTQSYIENHSDLLAGAILCDTLGAIPGVDEDHYPGVIAHPQALATGPTPKRPASSSGTCWQIQRAVHCRRGSPHRVGMADPRPRANPAVPERPTVRQAVSNEMTYSVIKGFHDLWLAENESRIRAELPILIVAGTDDPVVRKTATIQGLITRYMAEGHLTLDYRFYAGGRHETFNEPEKDRVHRDIGHWLSKVIDG